MTNRILAAVVALQSLSATSWAQPAAAPPAVQTTAPRPFADRLTGDWGGARTTMAEHGVTVDFDWTNFYQGLVSGTKDPSDDDGFTYGGRYDAFLNLDTKKMGLWKGGLFRVHAESYYGSLDWALGGVVAYSNLGVGLPNGGGDLEVTSMHLVQQLGLATVMLGKINTVDLLASHPFFGGGGYVRLFNVAFAAPPNGLQPPSITGGVLSIATQPVSWTFMVFDPNDRTQKYWLKDAFEDGVNVSASAKLSGRPAGRTTSLTVTGIYSTKDGVDLGDVLLPPTLQTDVKSGSWHASVQVDHLLRESAAQPGSGWGVFVKVGASDGNPNPFQGFITGGIGGKGVFAGRSSDTFGVGYFYYNLSDALQSAIDPLAAFDDEQGVEAYYDAALTPWLRIAGDMQYTDPATGANDNAFSAGLRLGVRF